jgi:hypothetical protein
MDVIIEEDKNESAHSNNMRSYNLSNRNRQEMNNNYDNSIYNYSP